MSIQWASAPEALHVRTPWGGKLPSTWLYTLPLLHVTVSGCNGLLPSLRHQRAARSCPQPAPEKLRKAHGFRKVEIHVPRLHVEQELKTPLPFLTQVDKLLNPLAGQRWLAWLAASGASRWLITWIFS
mmetsp:Transcript_42293/g.75919  ORF Transcript_42293/g.75919 Transcript_42293/m.75919 type:complete len:128 (+) Transcript_42293:843-1226(+)